MPERLRISGIAKTFAIGVIALATALQLYAQENGLRADDTSSVRATNGATATPVVPQEQLTLHERFTAYRQSTFHPLALLSPAAAAGVSQWIDYPPEWTQGGEGYGRRLASSYGSLVANNTIGFAIAAADHENLRYQPSEYPRNAIFRRAGYAIAHTFTSPLDSGGRTFAFSRVGGAYGAGFIVNTWYPAARFTTMIWLQIL